MSVEKAIREKHAFRERLTKFLAIAATMTNDELELGLARLVDFLNESENEAERRDIEIKGAVLNWFLGLRLAGEVSQDRKHRKSTEELKPELAYQRYTKAVEKWKAEGHLERWRQQQSQKTFWKRWLLACPPQGPLYWEFLYDIAEKDIEEHILNKITSFTLLPKDAPEPELTPEDVKHFAT